MKQINAFSKENQGIAAHTLKGTSARNDSSNSSFRLKKNIFLPLLMAAMTVTMMQAQVRIGEDKTPEKGALLDLNNDEVKGGLLLPNVKIIKLNEIPDDFTDADVHGGPHEVLAGMIVYNTNEDAGEGISVGLYVWDGAKWHPLKCGCGETPLLPAICKAEVYAYLNKYSSEYTTKVKKPDGTELTFLRYNLGADPEKSIKEQMGYLSPFSADKTHEDVTVYGGLFQWGRKDYVHSMRCDISKMPDSFTETLYTFADLDANGVPTSDNGKFVWGSNVENEKAPDGSGYINLDDWLAYDVSYYDNTYGMYPARWGNGGGLHTQTNTAYTSGQNVANPCPSGFRVPTQDEWALLMVNDIANDPENLDNDYFSASSSSVSFTGDRNPNIVWVRVENGRTATKWSTDGADGSYNIPGLSGYAIYDKDEWDDYTSDPDIVLTDPAAPEPALFLPAAGIRQYTNASVLATNMYGMYWTCVHYQAGNGTDLPPAFMLLLIDASVDLHWSYPHAIGMSVRCVSEGN